MLEIGQGNPDPSVPKHLVLSEADVDMIMEYYGILLADPKVDVTNPEKLPDPREASIDELMNCLQGVSVVERVGYRREVAGNAQKDFIKINKGETGQFDTEKKIEAVQASKTVSFKHMKYEVSEASGFVWITLEKHIKEDFTFWLRTFDGSAKAGSDYVAKHELLTMRFDENERRIKIEVLDDPDWEPDEEFFIRLLDEETQERLEGLDTECTVTIIDEDKPGSIGFQETEISVRRKDQLHVVKVQRTNGSDGEISCMIRTLADKESVPGKEAAKEGTDFIPIKDYQIVFGPGIVEQQITIEMPDCEGKAHESVDEDGLEI